MFSVKVWQFVANKYTTIFTGTREECLARRAAWFAEREAAYGHSLDMTRCIVE